jgi:F-type H+-transporting ATPase subunit epsilon
MAENIILEVVTPEKEVVNEAVQIVMAPGSRDENGKDQYVFVSGGFAEALPDKVTILAESAEKMEDIDPDRAKEAMARAEKRLAEDRAKEQVDTARAKAAIERAVMRIRIAGIGS